MKSILPHITLGEDKDGLVIVVIEDYELYDYISDYVVEDCGIEYAYMSSNTDVKPEEFTMHFSENYIASDIEKYLLKLDPVEVERIYLSNN